nr:MerR family transcriptional regulator [Nakamurella flava]
METMKVTRRLPTDDRPDAAGGLAPADAAAHCGVSLDTLRYYEREGLIGPVARTSGGRRSYDENDLFWVGLVTCLRSAGLGIADLREFTTLLRSEGDPGARVDFPAHHRAVLQQRAASIATARGVLDEKIAHYSAVPPPTDRPGEADRPVV